MPDQSGVLRDILASHRTLLAYIRTALSFAGLGFAVAKFGLVDARQGRVAAGLGTLMVLVGFALTIVGFVQHRALLRKLEPEAPEAQKHSAVLHIVGAVSSALVCVLLAIYLIATAG
jgi:uncharacterized membrane protein YidH (DUF202 family)